MDRLKSTFTESVTDQMPGKGRVPLASQLVPSNSAASAAGGYASAMPAVFPGKKHQTRPTVRTKASKDARGASFRSCTNASASASASARRCFTSDSKPADDDDSTGNSTRNAGAEKTAPTRRKAPSSRAKKIPKTRKEAFQHARKAGVINRLVKGGGVPRDMSDGDTLSPGQQKRNTENFTPSWNEKDYKVGGEVAGLPAVTELSLIHI